MKYEVFARINSGDDLLAVGSVDAPNDRLAKSYARATFDEEDWDYMAVVRRGHLLAVAVDAPDAPGAPAPGGDGA